MSDYESDKITYGGSIAEERERQRIVNQSVKNNSFRTSSLPSGGQKSGAFEDSEIVTHIIYSIPDTIHYVVGLFGFLLSLAAMYFVTPETILRLQALTAEWPEWAALVLVGGTGYFAGYHFINFTIRAIDRTIQLVLGLALIAAIGAGILIALAAILWIIGTFL